MNKYFISLTYILSYVLLASCCSDKNIYENAFFTTRNNPKTIYREDLKLLNVSQDGSVSMLYFSDKPHLVVGKPGHHLKFADGSAELGVYRVVSSSCKYQTAVVGYIIKYYGRIY